MKATILFILFAIITSLGHQPNLRYLRKIPSKPRQPTNTEVETDEQQPHQTAGRHTDAVREDGTCHPLCGTAGVPRGCADVESRPDEGGCTGSDVSVPRRDARTKSRHHRARQPLHLFGAPPPRFPLDRTRRCVYQPNADRHLAIRFL